MSKELRRDTCTAVLSTADPTRVQKITSNTIASDSWEGVLGEVMEMFSEPGDVVLGCCGIQGQMH